MTTTPITLRSLSSLDDCRAVVRVQEAVWGNDSETVPATVLFVSAKRGGILIGAFAAGPYVPGGLEPAGATNQTAETLVGFVWSLAGTRDGAASQWSHMLGVLPAHRQAGVAERLKMAQKEQALSAGVGLIEWTFDPLQAANAHLNLHVLGAVGATYGVDVYGALTGPLHRGTPTDRLIVEWRIREPRAAAGGVTAADAPVAVESVTDGPWVRCVRVETALTAPRVLVPVPPRFLDMQQQATELALEWRLKLRDLMTHAFAAGYRAVDFQLNREHGGGSYVLEKTDSRVV